MLESQNQNSTGNDLNVMSSDPDMADVNSGLRMVTCADGNTRFEKTNTIPASEIASAAGNQPINPPAEADMNLDTNMFAKRNTSSQMELIHESI